MSAIRLSRLQLSNASRLVLNRADPITRGMVNCGLFGAKPVDLANAELPITTTSSPIPAVTAVGAGRHCSGGSALNLPSTINLAAADVSCRILAYINSWPANFTALVDKATNASTREFSFFFDTSGNLDFGSIGTFSGITPATGMTAGQVWDFVVSRTMNGTSASIYVNGVLKGASGAGGTVGSGLATIPLGINPSGGGANADATYITAQFWTRAISQSEVTRLFKDPFCFLKNESTMTGYTAAAPTFSPAWTTGSNQIFPGVSP